MLLNEIVEEHFQLLCECNLKSKEPLLTNFIIAVPLLDNYKNKVPGTDNSGEFLFKGSGSRIGT